MTSYLSSLLTSTTNKYTSIRRTLLTDENDGDTEDDTHICRSMRAYYIEKQRPFPPWLPPDPNSRPAAIPQNSYGASSGPGSYYGSQPGPAGRAPGPPGGRKPGGLSDLWDSGPPQAQAAPQSLRSRPVAPSPQPSYGTAPSRGERYPAGGQGSARLAPGGPGGRPGAGSREGSYRSTGGGGDDQTALAAATAAGRAGGPGGHPGIARATSTQDRLKARLWGAGGNAGAPGNAGYR